MHLTIEQDPSKPMIRLEGHVRDMHTCVQAVHSVLKDVDVDIQADRAYKEVHILIYSIWRPRVLVCFHQDVYCLHLM